jgi:Lar family restriction alleviation protein
MSDDIKNCPCCGGKAIICMTSLTDNYSYYAQIECTECGLSIPLRDDGIKKWNRRVQELADWPTEDWTPLIATPKIKGEN